MCSSDLYLAMFAVVVRGRWGERERAPWWLRLAVCAAAAVTVLAVALDVVPILDVARPVLFGVKVGGAVALINAAGWWVYPRGGAWGATR